LIDISSLQFGAYGATDSQFDESSDNSVIVNDFAGGIITFDSLDMIRNKEMALFIR